jgi:putative phosphonate metabolism protein
MLATDGRVAIYAAPHPDDPLWAFGSRVLGYDAVSGALLPSPPPLRLDQACWDDLTAEPRRYGFHATLKAPFRLADGHSPDKLSAALSSYGAERRALAPFRLEIRAIGEFLALVPESAPEALGRLAADIVISFDGFRAELSQAERERRLAARLDARQKDYLDRYGYPYVLEEFRFHMSLTGKVRDPALREELRLALREKLQSEVRDTAFNLDALVLFAQPRAGEPFLIRERHMLQGRA